MEDAHGEGGLRAKIRSADPEGPKTLDANEGVRDWVKLAAAMNKHKPPKGEIASWKKHVEGYEKAVKEVAKAVKDDKDADLTKGLTAVNATCQRLSRRPQGVSGRSS